MMKNGIGKHFINNFVKSYESTNYVLKTSANLLGNKIDTRHGVTQGKSSSANIFSLFVSDMHESLDESGNHDFMDPYNLLQLADDTTVIADNLVSFMRKMTLISNYSRKKFLRIHPSKSKFLHITDGDPITENIIFNNNVNSSTNWQRRL